MSQEELPENPDEVPEDELLEEGAEEEDNRQPSGAPAWFISRRPNCRR